MTVATDPIYELKDIKHTYGREMPGMTRKHALVVDHLAISKSCITGLTGPNGSGKSTLLKLMAFAFKPTTGTVYLNGKAAFPFTRNVRFNVTLLTQEPYLLKRTVFHNIFYGMKLRGLHRQLTKAEQEHRISEAMEQVGLDFSSFAHRRWNELSGGEAQRVAMAARLVLRPQVLLLDEPTASVDVESADLIRKAANTALQMWGTTIIVASHDRNWLHGMCDTHLRLEQGRITSSHTLPRDASRRSIT